MVLLVFIRLSETRAISLLRLLVLLESCSLVQRYFVKYPVPYLCNYVDTNRMILDVLEITYVMILQSVAEGKIDIFFTHSLPRPPLNYLLTPCSRVLLEKLTGLQLVKKFPAF